MAREDDVEGAAHLAPTEAMVVMVEVAVREAVVVKAVEVAMVEEEEMVMVEVVVVGGGGRWRRRRRRRRRSWRRR